MTRSDSQKVLIASYGAFKSFSHKLPNLYLLFKLTGHNSLVQGQQWEIKDQQSANWIIVKIRICCMPKHFTFRYFSISIYLILCYFIRFSPGVWKHELVKICWMNEFVVLVGDHHAKRGKALFEVSLLALYFSILLDFFEFF